MGKLTCIATIFVLEIVFIIRLAVQTPYDWLLFGAPLVLAALLVRDDHLVTLYRMARWVWLPKRDA